MKLPTPKDRHEKPKHEKVVEATNGINMPRSNRGQGTRKASIELAINRFLAKNPSKVDKIAQIIVRAACGELTDTEARNLQRTRGIEFAKIILERVDGPVAKRLDLSIKTDKTLVLHDGPAVNLGNLLDGAEEAEVKQLDDS